MTIHDAAGPSFARLRGVMNFAATTAAGLIAAGVVASVDPNQPGHYPTCPFLWISGYYCPGCGSLRASHDLLHGDVTSAFARNPLALALLPAVLAAWVLWGLRLAGVTAWSPTKIKPGWIWTLLAVVLLYWAARNIPGWTWLSPA